MIGGLIIIFFIWIGYEWGVSSERKKWLAKFPELKNNKP